MDNNFLVVDFDDTLILDNSSRLLEKEIFFYVGGFRKKIISLFFISRIRYLLDVLCRCCSKLFWGSIDGRLKIIIFIANLRRKDFDLLTKQVVEKININRDLLDIVRSGSFIIASNALKPIIDLFCQKIGVEPSFVFSSTLIYNDDISTCLKLKSVKEKMTFLNGLHFSFYYTDDPCEIHFLNQHSHLKISEVFLSGKKIFEIFKKA